MAGLLEEPREVTFDWHIVQVMKWLEWDDGRHLDSTLVYASLDLRTAIERYILELLVLLKGGSVSKTEEKRCRSIDGVFALMRETDTHYRKTAQFTEIVARISPGMPEVRVVDTGYLHSKWKLLSEYCHKQLWPQESFASPQREFQEAGFRLIDEVLGRFHEWRWESVAGIIDVGSLSGETKEIYEKFVKGELTADQVERMLRLMQPVLEQRARLTERGGR
jgi:hypothetical protein